MRKQSEVSSLGLPTAEALPSFAVNLFVPPAGWPWPGVVHVAPLARRVTVGSEACVWRTAGYPPALRFRGIPDRG